MASRGYPDAYDKGKRITGLDAAYEGVRKVAWDGAFFRTDIGHRALQRQRR